MPGTAENPWAAELKTRKKSVPRKRSVHTNGNKGNENTDTMPSKLESNVNDDRDYCKDTKKKDENVKSDKNPETCNDDIVKNVKCEVNDTSNLNVRPSLSNANDSVKEPNINPKNKSSTLSCDPFMSSNSSHCPCPSKLDSKSLPTGDDKMSHKSDNSSITGDSETASPPPFTHLKQETKSKSPSKTGAKDKKESAESKEGNVPEKGRNDVKESKDAITSSDENKRSNANKVNFKDEIKDIPISRKIKTSNKQDKPLKNNDSETEKSNSKNIYMQARGNLRPTFDRQTSFNRKSATGVPDDGIEVESPVERLIRQDSMEPKMTKNKPPSDPKKTSRDEAREYLVLNYPADVRKNLKGLSTFSFEENDDVRPTVSSKNDSDKIDKNSKTDTSTVSSAESNKPTNVGLQKNATTIKTRKESEKKDGEDEWDDEEWEWESEEEEEEAPETITNGINKKDTNDKSNLTPSEKLQNGINITITNHMNGSNGVEDDDTPQDAKGKADINIKGNLLTINRNGPVEWSDDEYEESPVKAPPPPPPPPPKSPIPPPPPPPPGLDVKKPSKPSKADSFRKKPTKRPDWNDLMKEIEVYRYGHQGLNKVHTNDRSMPILPKNKRGGQFLYDSEKSKKEEDILKDIEKGVRLKHVKTNDRSKPNLRGIKAFKRQLTKEEKKKMGFAFDDKPTFDEEENDNDEEVAEIRDDLESTKQLLELEVRSKKLLEKDNKRLQAEVIKLRQEFAKISAGGDNSNETMSEDQVQRRKNSIQMKRQSMIRLISESEDDDAAPPPLPTPVKEPSQEKEHQTPKPERKSRKSQEKEQKPSEPIPTTPSIQEEPEQPSPPPNPPPVERASTIDEIPQEIEEMREEVDEARKLAEEWENKYKEMQRQISEFEMEPRISKKHSKPELQRLSSIVSNAGDGGADEDRNKRLDEEDEEWMLRREIHQLENKLRSTHDKREIVVRERKLLDERMENLVESIGGEVEARKRLRKEIKEMNEAFKAEIAEMMLEEQTQQALEDCYYSDEEDLVVNKNVKSSSDNEDEDEDEDEEENDVEETLEEIVKLAEDEDEEDDKGRELFEHYPESDDEEEAEEEDEGVVGDLLKTIVNNHDWLQKEKGELDHDAKKDKLKKKIDRHQERVLTMRKSNFMLKSKIDRLYDILQMQKEKHHDLKLELTRMLADIQ